MKVQRRVLDSSAGPRASRFRSPEEEELDRKRQELERLQAELAESELDLATLRSELVSFERRYLEAVGGRYAELDRLEALIAEAIARKNPTDAAARQEAESARARAEQSAEAMGDVGQEPSPCAFEPTEELKGLYRQAAKELHPDLTTDPADRARRQKAMAELNKAFEACDEDRMQEILGEWRSSPEQVRGNDTASQLIRVIREIAQARQRLEAIAAEAEALRQGQLFQLRQQVQEAQAEGRDLLAEIAEQLDAQIQNAQTRLKEVSKTGARR